VMTWIGRIGSFVFPLIAYVIAYRICLGLQHSDRAVLEHGIETGIVKRLPSGEFIEVHQPLGPVDAHGHPIPLDYQGASVPKRMNQLGYAGRPVAGVITVKDETGLVHHEATDGFGSNAGGAPHTGNGHTSNGHSTNGSTRALTSKEDVDSTSAGR